jgi:hypothetical protein
MGTSNDQQQHDQGGLGSTPEMSGYNNDWLGQSSSIIPESALYPDPAVINPEELATFPKQVKIDNQHHHHHHESHLVNKRTPVRDGRNITRTDNHPDRNGFM